MTISVFDIFKIGIGPSSSHTVGPMIAAYQFVSGLRDEAILHKTDAVTAELFGSLGATGKGHGSDKAIMLGFAGELPDAVDPDRVPETLAGIREAGIIELLGDRPIVFDETRHLMFRPRELLPHHPNGMRFTAYASDGSMLLSKDYYSVGGGFVIGPEAMSADRVHEPVSRPPHCFKSAAELLQRCAERRCTISRLMLDNEQNRHGESAIRHGLLTIWRAMQDCVERGCRQEGILPGGMRVKRRAAGLYRQLNKEAAQTRTPLVEMDWVNLFALAVNEENAAGGRVVTAPTNGAAGIIPAVLHYYVRFCPGADDDGVIRFLLTAGAIAILYKENASISGAEVGCQGEVGVACSMAAGALTEVLGGTPEQVENAAEIGMEHNLGLTCDPVGGLVQVPCIERNAMGAIKAINAARMALRGDGTHFVSLDKVIKTMRETGADMKTKYKETARGGLAVNVIEC